MSGGKKVTYIEAEAILNNGGVVIAPTDTLYGVLAKATDIEAVHKVDKLKGRSHVKSYIVLISDVSLLEHFWIQVNPRIKTFLSRVWPGPVTVALSVGEGVFPFLREGHKSIAFRLPKNEKLVDLIKNTGPLIAPSANPEGLTPASSIEDAQKYFGDEVGGYIDGGIRTGMPSTVISFEMGELDCVREGALPFEWIKEIWEQTK